MAIEVTASANLSKVYRAPETPPAIRENGPVPPQGRQVADYVDISDTARNVANLLGSLPPLSGILGSFQENIAAFGNELGNKFRAAGIDTSRPIDLRVDTKGHVRVTNAHPDQDRIEAIFAEDPEFANRFRGLTAAAEIQKAVADHMEFSRAYEQDPDAALARFSDLFSDKRSAEVRFRFTGADLTAFFTDKAVTPSA